MTKKKYCYALVSGETGKLILTNRQLSIYWLRIMAQTVKRIYPKSRIVKIDLDELHKFLNAT